MKNYSSYFYFTFTFVSNAQTIKVTVNEAHRFLPNTEPTTNQAVLQMLRMKIEAQTNRL